MASNADDDNQKAQRTCLKILVVDDDEMSRRLMRLLLVRDGHDIQVAGNGLEALEAVKEQKFDVVFMDLQMPVMSGIEASRRIREWENGDRHTYIVALTASFMPEQGPMLFEAGIDNYISKPFEVEHIQRLLGFIAHGESGVTSAQPAQAENMSAGSCVLDVEKGLIRVGGDLQTYRELLRDFIQELPERIRTLEEFANQRDLASLARAAHNLKGVSSSLGALQLSECAGKLDKPSNEDYTDHQQAILVEIKRAGTELNRIATDFLTKQASTVAAA